MRINSQPFVIFVLKLVLERRRAPREESKKERKGRKDQARKGWIKWLQQEYLQLIGHMYDFLAGFGMHGICMCVFGSFFVIGMGFS